MAWGQCLHRAPWRAEGPQGPVASLAEHELCAGPARGGTAGVWHGLFPCPSSQRINEPLSRQLNPQAGSLFALCQSTFPWEGEHLPVCLAAGTLLTLLSFQSDNSKYLNSQHSDGKGSCQVHVRLKGVQDHGVAALGKTEHGETHLSCSHSRALLGQEVLSDPGTRALLSLITSPSPMAQEAEVHGTVLGRGRYCCSVVGVVHTLH